MKRRTFIEALALVPAASATALAQPPAAAPPAPPGAQTPAPGRPGGGPGGASAPPLPDPLTYGTGDDAGATVVKHFAPSQFAALARLARLFMPPADGSPGAADVGAADFLDFYVGRSPADRQRLYAVGLDGLDARAKQRHSRPFGETDDAQADAIVMEFLSRPWSYQPKDPIEAFLRVAQLDIRKATQNSSVYAATAELPTMVSWLRPL